MTYPHNSRRGRIEFKQGLGRALLPALACALLAPAFFSGGCAKPSYDKTKAFPIAKSPRAFSPDANITYNYLLLGDALDKGDNNTAAAAVAELVELAPSPEIYIQAAMIFERGNQPDKALETVRAGTAKYPDDFSLHMVWAELLEQNGHPEQALTVLKNFEPRYEKLLPAQRQAYLNEIGSLRQYSLYLLLGSRPLDEAASYLKSIRREEFTPTLLFYEVVLLRNQNRHKQSLNKLYELLRNYPDFTDGWLTLAADMEKAGDFKSAARFYGKALESNPAAEIYLHMLSAQIQAGDAQSAQSQVIASPFPSEVKIQAALLFMDAKEYKAARAILLALQKDPHAADDTAMYLGMIAYDTGENLSEALERLQDISPDAENKARMLHLQALLYIRANDYASAFKAALSMRDEYPDNKENWAFLAELANVTKDYKQSENISREALEQWPDDVPIMYSLAMSLSFQQHNPQAMQVLEDILILDANNILALNALAYTMAENKTDLPRALLLARQALAQQPDNSSILDTIAWVYYQMGDFNNAWKMISLCVSKGVEEAIIWEHYGDIALALGNNAAARTGYDNAIKIKADDSAKIREKLRKLN